MKFDKGWEYKIAPAKIDEHSDGNVASSFFLIDPYRRRGEEKELIQIPEGYNYDDIQSKVFTSRFEVLEVSDIAPAPTEATQDEQINRESHQPQYSS